MNVRPHVPEYSPTDDVTVEDGEGNRVVSIESFYDDEVEEDTENGGPGDDNTEIESYYV